MARMDLMGDPPLDAVKEAEEEEEELAAADPKKE